MIFSGFVYIAGFILSLIIGVLPTGNGFPPQVAEAFTALGGYVQILNTLLPIPTMAWALGILISVDVAVFSFKTFKWILSHIPAVGGKG